MTEGGETGWQFPSDGEMYSPELNPDPSQRMLSRDGPNQDWHEMLQEILESGNSTEIDFVQRLLTRSSDSLRRGNDNGPAPS